MQFPLINWNNIKNGYTFMQPTTYSKHHLGIDKIVPIGTAVFSPVNGEILRAFSGSQGGNTIWLLGDDNKLWRFLHNSRFEVREHQRVNEGQIIARSGNTGMSTGPHVHIDISLNGHLQINNINNFLNPDVYLRENVKPQSNPTCMFSFEESLDLVHMLFRGRGANQQEKTRWYAQPHTRATIDAAMQDLCENTRHDNNKPTETKDFRNALAFYIRGTDLSDLEINGLEHKESNSMKVARGLIEAEDRKRAAQGLTPKLQ